MSAGTGPSNLWLDERLILPSKGNRAFEKYMCNWFNFSAEHIHKCSGQRILLNFWVNTIDGKEYQHEHTYKYVLEVFEHSERLIDELVLAEKRGQNFLVDFMLSFDVVYIDFGSKAAMDHFGSYTWRIDVAVS